MTRASAETFLGGSLGGSRAHALQPALATREPVGDALLNIAKDYRLVADRGQLAATWIGLLSLIALYLAWCVALCRVVL